MQPGHAEIVGAGFGGLVAAIALAERGWTVRVHERRDSLRGEGYGIAIHNNMARIFAAFGILDRVLAGGMRIDRRDSVDAHGNVVMTRKTTRSPYRIDRQHIIALLAERARGGRRRHPLQFAGRSRGARRLDHARGWTKTRRRSGGGRRRHQFHHSRCARPRQASHLGPRLRRADQHSAAARGDRRRSPRGHGDDRGLGGQAARALLPGDRRRNSMCC